TIQTIQRGAIEFKSSITDVVLWISTTKKVKNLIDINSIQFLLAIQTWKEIIEGFNLKPKIYYSHHEKPKPPQKNQKAKKKTGGKA
ncbi:DUF6119 family protein, partial [Klebsiella pneumoniae]|nr:TIGR04141 family sporadically distributed protein [Klebsiella pneumoniae]